MAFFTISVRCAAEFAIGRYSRRGLWGSFRGDESVAERRGVALAAHKAACFHQPGLPAAEKLTDLYYSDPSNLGNPNLKPESALSYEGGADFYIRPNLHASTTLFQRRDKNVIDYVAAPGSSIYVATNFDNLHFTGVETGLIYDPRSTPTYLAALQRSAWAEYFPGYL